MTRSEEPGRRISILWHGGFLHIFLHRSSKTALENAQNSPLQHFEVNIRGNFQNRKFSFFPIFSTFCLKKIPFYGTLGFLTRVSVDCQIPKTSSIYSIFKLTFPEIFKNERFHFSQYPQNFFSDL